MTRMVMLPPNLILGAPPFEPTGGLFMPIEHEQVIRRVALQMAEAHPKVTWYLHGANLYSERDRPVPCPIPAEYTAAVEAWETLWREREDRE